MKPRVGVVGLGHLGQAIAGKLLAAGFLLAVYNRTATKAEPLARKGARLASSPRDLAENADVVITIVSDDDALEALTRGADGILAGLAEGSLLIDMSTLSPGAVERAASEARNRGAEMLHAPILGGPMNVTAGNGTIIIGGSEETAERARPLLEAISKPVLYVGPLINGTRMKMALNIMLTHLLIGIASSLAFAGRANLDQKRVLSIFAGAAGAFRERLGGKMLSGETDVTFAIRTLEKDQRYFLAAAAELGLKLPTVAATQRLLEEAIRSGRGEEDYTAIYRFLLESSQ